MDRRLTVCPFQPQKSGLKITVDKSEYFSKYLFDVVGTEVGVLDDLMVTITINWEICISSFTFEGFPQPRVALGGVIGPAIRKSFQIKHIDKDLTLQRIVAKLISGLGFTGGNLKFLKNRLSLALNSKTHDQEKCKGLILQVYVKIYMPRSEHCLTSYEARKYMNAITNQDCSRFLNSWEIPNMLMENLSEIVEQREDQCSICLATFRLAERVIQLRCKHIFHEICSVKWFDKERICPLCRSALESEWVNVSPTDPCILRH